jgi:predicted ArsR family transcriptional regulator
MSRRVTPAKERLLFLLKLRGPLTTEQLAEATEVTPAGVRQHLADLERQKLVSFVEQRGQVGRPARKWQLVDNDIVNAWFPDRHADLSVSLLRSAEELLGEDAVGSMLAQRTSRQLAAYGDRAGDTAELGEKVATLAELRTGEGYMAEWSEEDEGAYRLVENHCPVCAAATVCPGLCRSELDLFRRFFGPDVTVERDEYLLDGDRRCGYAIRPSLRST